jgi:hypothetical protein
LYLHLAGVDKDVISGKNGKGFIQDKELLENLAEAEHLRWNAFHYTQGYQRACLDEMCERCGAPDGNILPEAFRRDEKRKVHICLVNYYELDDLSNSYASLVGKPRNFKQDDRNNIQLIPNFLAANK